MQLSIRDLDRPCLNRRLQEDKGDTTFIQHWVGLTRWPFRNQCKWWRFQCGLRVGVGFDCLTGGNFQFDYPRGRYCKSGCPDVGLLCKKRRKIGFGQNWQCFTTPSKIGKSGWRHPRGGEFLIGPFWAAIYLHDESFAFRTNVLSGRQLGVAGCRFVLGGCHVSKACHALIRGGNDTRVWFYVGLIK